ncbi:collagen alpha-2(I) chain-like isoform X2 [Mytilus trossulus]|uniref:collagen alpha-2(I) chain-like isoform X2 n=2 Tax=Mytilus trossulus TaxID=6551 RepID=UPI003006480B
MFCIISVHLIMDLLLISLLLQFSLASAGYFYPQRAPQQPSYNSQQKWAHSNAQASTRLYAKNKGHAAAASGYGGSRRCSKKVDFVFLYDNSASIVINHPSNFERIKEFMKDIVMSFSNIGSLGAQFSAVGFCGQVTNSFSLKDHGNKAGVISAINSLQSAHGKYTGIGLGLQYVYKNSFNTVNGGGRAGVREIVVVLTDGENNVPPPPVSQAQLLKNYGVIIVAVGVGSKTDVNQLNRIASRPDLVFHVDSFNALPAISSGIVQVTCQETSRRPVTPTCARQEDIVFMFDDSYSIFHNNPQNFNMMKDFMKDIVGSFTAIGRQGTQFSSVCFASKVTNHFYLKDYSSRAGIVSAIDRIVPSNGAATAIGLGLQFVRLNSFLVINGGQRHGVRELVIVLTDGRNNRQPDPVQQANILKAQGVTIMVIGVGSDVDITQLVNIASAPSLVFHVASVSSLFTIREAIVATACLEQMIDTTIQVIDISGAVGQPGERGATGSTGSAGQPGNQGPMGTRGPRGPGGMNGQPGSKGEPGDKGEMGDKGPSGDPGTMGQPGRNGRRGNPGEQGTKGEPGVNGMNGGPGDRGMKGETGDKGSLGDPGMSGPNGMDGIPGQPGKDGGRGPNGYRGMKGEPGDKGEMGGQGPMGIPGMDGKDGKNGKPGNRGEPGEKGVPGDHGMPGQKGRRGSKGGPGDKGADGGPGLQGPNGLIGPAGNPGPNGMPGTDGKKGPRGDMGAKGQNGDPGMAGPEGARGRKGPKGSSGKDGTPGNSGADGIPGSKGEPGDKGLMGDMGLQGPRGNNGEKGLPGDSGMPGNNGDDGKPGPRGMRGEPGNKGEDGGKGPDGMPGMNGWPGKKGKDGVPGSRGEPGFPGPNGLPGKTGEMGGPGIPGVNGKDGMDGKNGKPGYKGPMGDKGPQGPWGSKGPKGDKGDKGEGGNNGRNGKDGKDGRDGKTGKKGPCGDKGPDGRSGTIHIVFDNLKNVGYTRDGITHAGAAAASSTLSSFSNTGLNSAILGALQNAGVSNSHFHIGGSSVSGVHSTSAHHASTSSHHASSSSHASASSRHVSGVSHSSQSHSSSHHSVHHSSSSSHSGISFIGSGGGAASHVSSGAGSGAWSHGSSGRAYPRTKYVAVPKVNYGVAYSGRKHSGSSNSGSTYGSGFNYRGR